MTLDEFWEHIRLTKREKAGEHADALTAHLAKLPPAEIIDFDHWWGILKSEAYTWDVWGAAYTLNGGCSDDSFSDFRSWLVLQGRDVFQAVVSNPDSLLDHANSGCRCECYPAMSAWFVATGTERNRDGYSAWSAQCDAQYPPQRVTKSGRSRMGEKWDFDDKDEAYKRIPRIAERAYGKRRKKS